MFKTYEDFKEAIEKLPLYVKEAEFVKSKKPPFLVYFRSEVKKITADGIVVLSIDKISIELYTELNDNDSEKILNDWLAKHNIVTKKYERVWITNEKFYMTSLEFECCFNGKN